MTLSSLCKLTLSCSLTLLATEAYPQTAFQTQLRALADATKQRRTYEQDRRTAEVVSSLSSRYGFKAAGAVPAPASAESTRNIGIALTDIVETIETGTAAVFTGAGLTALNENITKNESTWQSQHIRNGFDKAKPYFDIGGNILVGASLILSSKANGQAGISSSKGAAGVAGVVALAAGSLLQHFLGSKTSQLDSAAGTVNGIQVDLAQLEFSRAAYDDLELRYQTAKRYYDQAKAQVPPLLALLARCKAARDNPNNVADDDLRQLIDDVSAARDTYGKSADFVDVFTKQLADAYQRYKTTYPVLAPQLDPLIGQIQMFQSDYDTSIQKGFLADFPKFASELADLRAEVGK